MSKSNNKILNDLDNSQKEALELLTDNQTYLFMKKNQHNFLNICMNIPSLKNPNLEEFEDIAKKQAEYRIFFFNQSKVKGFNADCGIIEANIEHEFILHMNTIIKEMFLKLIKINENIKDFGFHYKSFLLIMIGIYERECCYYNSLTEDSKQILKDYKKLENEFVNLSLELLAKNSYERSKELKENILQDKKILLSEDMNEIYSMRDLTYLDDSINEKIDDLEKIYNNMIILFEELEKPFERFDKLSEDGFFIFKERLKTIEDRDNFKLPSNYIFDMEDFKVKIRAFV